MSENGTLGQFFSLAFHILFACAGVGLPLPMVLAEVQWLRTGERGWLRVNQARAKGTAVLFAIGAVSGTVLSFELGLRFPRFLEKAGPVIGLPFALEGYAFFAEAIFLGGCLCRTCGSSARPGSPRPRSS